MGFLKFLKKKEEKAPEEELDIPPAPPSVGEEDLGLESLGEELPRPTELPELPEIEEEPEEPKEEVKEEEPEAPSFRPERFVPLEEIERGPIKKEKIELKKIREHKEITKPIFIKLGSYKDVLDEIEMIRGHLNNFDKVSIRLDDLKEDKDKKFEKWNECFKDMQKKLVFIDKTLFAK